MDTYHISVLLQEAVDALKVKPGKKYIDGTLGGGGHTGAILERGGEVLGIDFDEEALEYVGEKLKVKSSKFKVGEDLVLARGNFKDIDVIAKEKGFKNVSGIILDLGVSSHHFDTAERGFSFQKEGPLDMRMDQSLHVKAADLINILTRGEMYELFTKLGEEWGARPIIESIIRARQIKPIETTGELAEIISRGKQRHKSESNPATRIFQALRIAVNDELNNLREVLPKAVALLAPGGRLAIISFHSLEDRIVKHTFKQFEDDGLGKIITKKPVVPGEEEIERNKRARSAKLRVFEKL